MMPDLGKYADAVLSAYAVSIVLLVAIVGMSLWRGKRVLTPIDVLCANSVQESTQHRTAIAMAPRVVRTSR